jgi:hypothetical protein
LTYANVDIKIQISVFIDMVRHMRALFRDDARLNRTALPPAEI